MLRTLRQPIMIMPTLVFPLFLLAINASGLSAATDIPGFPTDSYLTFALAFPFIQGSIFATNTAGTNLAEDIGSGFFNRLSLTPMRGSALLAGQLAGVLLVAIVQAITYLLRRARRRRRLRGRASARHPGAVRALVRDLRARSAPSACSSGCARAPARPSRGCSR